MKLTDDITVLKGIGEKTAGLFNRVGVSSLWDLINYLPADYIKYPETVKTESVVPGEKASLKLTIKGIPQLRHIRRLSILNCQAFDETGVITLTWYNMPYLKKALKPGMTAVFYGNAVLKNNTLMLTQPRIFKEDEYKNDSSHLSPVYPLTKGLNSKTVNKYVLLALKGVDLPEDFLDENERKELELEGLRESLEHIHMPENEDQIKSARQRLVFNEFCFFIKNIRALKEKEEREKNPFFIPESAQAARYIETLPFKLTDAQTKAYKEILSDMSSDYVMNRLVQGDVGSGKTVVALLSMINVIAAGYQAVLMTPTEVLAMQHMKKLSEAGKALDIECVLLSGALTEKEKKEAREKIKNGEARLIIGTHALITDLVEFDNLALAITDEQHRFGVGQRKALSDKCKGRMPHVLVMSATPIPRTLATILYGDLDISVMDELPQSRLPVKNCVVGKEYRKKAWDFIKKEVEEGRQAYVICPLVEENESTDTENVTDYSGMIRDALGDGINVGMLHGRMRPKEKDRIMEEFSDGNIDVLVSTTVVEVGVDVPNATVMMIENAERFGLSQLHQLRGRIGRGDKQSYCIFMNNSGKEEKSKRLEIMNKTNDGFKIASEDLKLRGPGDVFGVRQSGEYLFKVGDIYTDADILKKASGYAERCGDRIPDSIAGSEESLYGGIL